MREPPVANLAAAIHPSARLALTMKAVRLHAPRDARCEEVPIPRLGPDDVLVRVRTVAICATDIELFEGVMVYLTTGMAKYPLIPGHEWSGEVVDLGSDVEEFSVGDRVVGECSIGCRRCDYCRRGWYHLCPERAETGILRQNGGFAEYIVFPRFFLHRCNGLNFEGAAFTEPTAVAINAVKRTGVSPGDRVAVFGPGPIGLFAVQVAKAYGARQIVLVGTRDERLSVGKAMGADITINSKKQRLNDAVREATNGEMIDVVIEAAGAKDVWPDIASVVAPRSRIAMTGLFGGAKCDVDFDPLVVNEVAVCGCLGSPNLWTEAISLHLRGLVRSDGIVTHRFRLEQFSSAIDIARNRVEGAIKVVVEP